MDRKPCIYFVEGAKNGCNFYRIKQPANALINMDSLMCCSSSMLKNIDEQTLWTDKADVIVSQCGTSEKYLDYVLSNRGKKKFILDYDDYIFGISPYNPSYKQNGTRNVEVELADGTKQSMWEHGRNGFDINENQARMFIFTEMLKNVDLVTTPSSVLAGAFRSHGANNVKVLKNYLDLNIWYPIKMEKDEYVRIGYQGGWSHYEDWYEIKEAMEVIMEKHKNVILILMGCPYDGLYNNLPKDRLVIEYWVDVEVYPWKWKTMNIDIGIAPLFNNLFSTCKSEIKWEEYSALRIPSILQNIPPYNLNVIHGETGYLASNKDEWIEYLDLLITNKELRNKIGDQARAEIEEKYDLSKEITNYESTYKSLFRPELLAVI